MSDFQDEDDFEEADPPGSRPKGRAYVHTRCGGETLVSGNDFTHICDPFWPCSSTYCCTCADFAPLSNVQWVDTGESVSAFRSRVRARTPGLVQAWRYGVGLLVGGAFGAAAGLLVRIVAKAPENKIGAFALVGGLVGAVVCYLLGTIALNRMFGVDYRRMR
jgi:hypothetical protein